MAGTKFSDISFAIWSRTLRSIAVSNTTAASTLSLARTWYRASNVVPVI